MNMEIELRITRQANLRSYSFSEKGQIEEHSELMEKLIKQIERYMTSRPISELDNMFGSSRHPNITVLDIINGIKTQKTTMSVCLGDILEDDLPYSSTNIKRLKNIKNMLYLNPSWLEILKVVYGGCCDLNELESQIKSLESLKSLRYCFWMSESINGIDPEKIEYYPEVVLHKMVLSKISIILKQGYDVKTSRAVDGGICIHVDNRNFKQR